MFQILFWCLILFIAGLFIQYQGVKNRDQNMQVFGCMMHFSSLGLIGIIILNKIIPFIYSNFGPS